MRLRQDGGREYWELSADEVALRTGRSVRQRDVAPDVEAPAVESKVVWDDELGEGIQLHQAITNALVTRGHCIFSGEMVRVSRGLIDRIGELHAQFDRLESPSFGKEGASSFFAGRKLLAGEVALSPQEIDGRSDRNGFLGSLFKATIKALPDFSSDMTYPIGWIFSRHDHPVERMPFHHDRVGWLAQFNICRTPGIHGGSVEIRDAKADRIVATSSLKGFLDGYIVRDDQFEHGTSGITMDNPGLDHRDVIVIRLPVAAL